MRYGKDELEKILDELNLIYEYEKIDDDSWNAEIFYIRLKVGNNTYLSGVILDHKREILSVMVPHVTREIIITTALMEKVNNLNIELTYGSLYINRNKDGLVYKIASSIQDNDGISVGQISEYIQEVVTALIEVESWMIDGPTV